MVPSPPMADRAGSPAAVLGAPFAGKYRLVQLLRTGGVSHVYLAEMMTLRPAAEGARGPELARTGRAPRFALKVLRAELANDRSMVRRFERGVLAASRVVHPNVARVGMLERLPDGVPFCTMELLVGLDLADTLAQARRLDPKRAVRIAEGIASGLAAAHDEGVVHLDVKPENVFLVHQADGREIVKLLDFGLAAVPKGAPSKDAAPTLAPSKDAPPAGSSPAIPTPVEQRDSFVDAAFCTPEYMAPEQRRGVPATPAMDVYALGAVLLEMLTGHPPSAAEAPWPGAPPSKEIPPSLARVLDRALARDPEARFASMKELRAALLAAVDERTRADHRSTGLRSAK